jgi:hypothetical protein
MAQAGKDVKDILITVTVTILFAIAESWVGDPQSAHS